MILPNHVINLARWGLVGKYFGLVGLGGGQCGSVRLSPRFDNDQSEGWWLINMLVVYESYTMVKIQK